MGAIVEVYQSGQSQAAVIARFAELSELERNGWSLHIGTYVGSAADSEGDVEGALAAMYAAQEEYERARTELERHLQAAGYA